MAHKADTPLPEDSEMSLKAMVEAGGHFVRKGGLLAAFLIAMIGLGFFAWRYANAVQASVLIAPDRYTGADAKVDREAQEEVNDQFRENDIRTAEVLARIETSLSRHEEWIVSAGAALAREGAHYEDVVRRLARIEDKLDRLPAPSVPK